MVKALQERLEGMRLADDEAARVMNETISTLPIEFGALTPKERATLRVIVSNLYRLGACLASASDEEIESEQSLLIEFAGYFEAMFGAGFAFGLLQRLPAIVDHSLPETTTDLREIMRQLSAIPPASRPAVIVSAFVAATALYNRLLCAAALSR
jgi:hypothetical protein